MRTLGLAVSATVLALSLLAHVLSFVPGVPISMSVAWPLHLGAMVVFGMTIIDGMRVRRGTARREGESLFAFWQRASNESRGAFGRLLEMVPLPVTVLVLALVAYTFVNFFAFGLGVQGTPGQKNGRYYLHDHGTHVRDLTREEFIHYRAIGVGPRHGVFFGVRWLDTALASRGASPARSAPARTHGVHTRRPR